MANTCIYSYIDTLLDKFLDWHRNVFTGNFNHAFDSLEQIFGTNSSDNRSRANELYNIGLISEQITRKGNGLNLIKQDKNIESCLGYITALIYSAYRQDKTNQVLQNAMSAICAVISLVQYVEVDGVRFSINYFIQQLLKIYPVGQNISEITWLRYLLSAGMSEIEKGDKKGLLDFLGGVSNHVDLHIYSIPDSNTGETKLLASINNPADLSNLIKGNFQLIGIVQQKSPLFILGNDVDYPRGFYGIALKHHSDFLTETFRMESSSYGREMFKHLFDNPASVLATLSQISEAEDSYKSEYINLMKTIQEGAIEALKQLGFPVCNNTLRHNALTCSPQIIYFGAPGTGKSHAIKEECIGHKHFRITFHPDTDYASFVGAYKPVTYVDTVGTDITTKKISYNYVFQPFMKAYVAAWLEMQNPEPKPVYLVIEEINRGNCAQIFGDLFQLLDRNDEGFSEYAITTDSDLQDELFAVFKDLDIPTAEAINALFNEDIVSQVKAGTHLLLPNNLMIRATMNTSDQSLFPIDSAFKRRWEWKYVKITDAEMNYRIVVNRKEYDWWDFVQKINEHIDVDTDQEDKKLGYFFAKAKKNAEGNYIITADTFLSKVIYFLYSDVYKDFGFNDDMFKDAEDHTMKFADFFDENGNTIESQVEQLLINLKVKLSDEIKASGVDSDTSLEATPTEPENKNITVDGMSVARNPSFAMIVKAALEHAEQGGESLTYEKLLNVANNTFKTPTTGEKMQKRFFLKDSEKEEYLTNNSDASAKSRYKFNIKLTDTDGLSFYAFSDWGPESEPSIFRFAESLGVKTTGLRHE